MWADTNGLSLPAKAPEPTHLVMTYLWAQIGWSELGDGEGTVAEVLDQIHRLPKPFWVYPVAAIMTAIANHGVTEGQAEMVEAYSVTPTGRRVKAFLDAAAADEKNRALFSPKPLMGLAKLALAHSPDEGDALVDDPNEVFLQTYLKLCDVVEAAATDAKETAQTDDDAVRNILRFWVQEGEYGAAGGYGEPIVRLYHLLSRIPEAQQASPTPAEVLEASTGISLERFLTLASAVLAFTAAMDTGDPESIGRHVQFDPEDLVRLTDASREEIQFVFDKLALTEEDVANFQSGDPSEALYYSDYSAFRLRPLWRVETPLGVRYVPVSVPFLTWRVSDGLYWDVADAMRSEAGGGSAGQKAVGQFMTDFGEYLEVYVESLFSKALPPSLILAPRFYTGVRTSPNDPELDLVLPYGDAFVVVEQKAARFHYLKSVIPGDLDHIEGHDLEKKMLFGPVAQLDEAIRHLQSGAVDFDGRRYEGEAVFPVLVTYGSLPTMWPVWPRLLEAIEERGLLRGPNVRRLSALDIGEVEVLAALVARGHTARDVIQGYVEGEHQEVSFRNYAYAEYGEDTNVRRFLKEELDEMLDLFKGFFRRPD